MSDTETFAKLKIPRPSDSPSRLTSKDIIPGGITNRLLTKSITGQQVFKVDTINGWVNIGIDQPQFNQDPNIVLYITKDVDSYSGVNLTNKNAGTLASTDMVITNDTVDPFGGFVDLGINSSGWADPDYATFDAAAGFVYCVDNNFYAGTAGATSDLHFFTGGHDSKDYIRATIDHHGNMGIGTTTPNANAILDLTSTTKAFMPPRVTTTQRDNIASPTEGMVVYNTTTQVLNFYTGVAWAAV